MALGVRGGGGCLGKGGVAVALRTPGSFGLSGKVVDVGTSPYSACQVLNAKAISAMQ